MTPSHKSNLHALPPGTEYAPQLGGRRSPFTGREPELSGLRALLPRPLIVHVDDETALLSLMRLALERVGHFQVVSFTTTQETLDFCHHTRPDVLMTDIMRPDGDGLEMCRLVRADPDLYDLPLLVHSACASTLYECRGLDVVYVPKPCDIAHLAGELDRLAKSGHCLRSTA
jgi:CheY-like chemotaxis protein